MDKIRTIENLYVICWLIKDMCWMLAFKQFAIFMIVPTLLLAFYVLILSPKTLRSLSANIAMICWIGANSVWMLHDFYLAVPITISKLLFVSGIIAMFIYIWLVFIQPKRDTLIK